MVFGAKFSGDRFDSLSDLDYNWSSGTLSWKESERRKWTN